MPAPRRPAGRQMDARRGQAVQTRSSSCTPAALDGHSGRTLHRGWDPLGDRRHSACRPPRPRSRASSPSAQPIPTPLPPALLLGRPQAWVHATSPRLPYSLLAGPSYQISFVLTKTSRAARLSPYGIIPFSTSITPGVCSPLQLSTARFRGDLTSSLSGTANPAGMESLQVA